MGTGAGAGALCRLAGHQAGVDNIQPVLEHSVEMGVKVLTIYAFSTEMAAPARRSQRPLRACSG
ncbi:MAG: undecaprenyl diphosphate synthase family protein [Caldilineaceae bacterium]